MTSARLSRDMAPAASAGLGVDDQVPPKLRGRAITEASVPSHWRGLLPDPSVDRPLPERHRDDPDDRCVRVPMSLLHGGFPDLGILVWVQLRLWFGDQGGTTTYRELAHKLASTSDSRGAVIVKFSAALRPLLGTWIQRQRQIQNLYTYRAVTIKPRDKHAVLRQSDVDRLEMTAKSDGRVKPADLADFARWQLECGRRGWTAEQTGLIASRWGVTSATVRASRKRLQRLGLLTVVPREGPGRLSDIVWLSETYDPATKLIDPVPTHWRPAHYPRSCSRMGVGAADAAADMARLGESRPEDGGQASGLTLPALRHRRAVRRHQAIAALTSPSRSAQRPNQRQDHEVYLIHFPSEGCFKVGLSRCGASRVEYFVRQGGIVVDRVLVSSRCLAELVEADILQWVEEWHRLGDRLRRGGGYTEMWSDEGPTVDLHVAAQHAIEFVARVKTELVGGGPS